MSRVVLVSACLLGLNTRYDGTSAENAEIIANKDGDIYIPVCPEQLGGLPTPRPRAEIKEGTGADVLSWYASVIDETGTDRTYQFIAGAEEVLKIARLTGATEARLKEKSPSCGAGLIKQGGKESDNEVSGPGVTAALLIREGFLVIGFD